ncbi:MAG: radical SAM/SPASM domain-containing protein [Vicinamibacterales bacterium]
METYGFGGRLTAAFPSQVNVDPTELCNLSCVHCPHPSFKRSAYYAGRTLDPALNSKLVAELATDGRGAVKHLRYSSEGEPLLHPRMFDMLTEAVAGSGTFVSMTSNGTLLDGARAERLLATGVGLVDISIDAHRPETYAAIRVRGDLAVTRANVERLLDLRTQARLATRVVVSFIEQPGNLAERDDFVRFWRDRGADDVVVRPLLSAAGAMVSVADLMRGRPSAATRRPCVYPWERIVLTPRGTLAFCPADWTHESSLVDFRDHSIREVWGGRQYQALRAAHLGNDFGSHAFCGRCPDWQATRWPSEGRAYAQMIEDLKETA